MSAADNKRLLQDAFAALETGNGQPFVDCMADEFSWVLVGTTPWSGTYTGKAIVRRELFAPLFAQFADRYTNTALRFIAEDDYVVVECQGKVTTRTGKPYNNTYCYVCRFSNGRMVELTEYMDTALLERALEPPDARSSGITLATRTA
jgi:ketosteroid isomerase-like protein